MTDWKNIEHDSDTCDEPECMVCGARDCPHGEPLHYHHEGCPAGCKLWSLATLPNGELALLEPDDD